VNLLTTLVTVVYFAAWAGAGVVLVGSPALKLFAGDARDIEWGLRVPEVVLDSEATVQTRWGAARLELEDLSGTLRIPLALMPWWLFALLWGHVAAAFTLALLFLHHLRRIFHTVRAGSPFDPANATRMRTLGWLLLALALLDGMAGSVVSLAVRSGSISGGATIPLGFHMNGLAALIALVLVVLAEIFRRGADLEHDQSLVI
jgi:hypothetical protein